LEKGIIADYKFRVVTTTLPTLQVAS